MMRGYLSYEKYVVGDNTITVAPHSFEEFVFCGPDDVIVPVVRVGGKHMICSV